MAVSVKAVRNRVATAEIVAGRNTLSRTRRAAREPPVSSSQDVGQLVREEGGERASGGERTTAQVKAQKPKLQDLAQGTKELGK
jgi:hypothetical protein